MLINENKLIPLNDIKQHWNSLHSTKYTDAENSSSVTDLHLQKLTFW